MIRPVKRGITYVTALLEPAHPWKRLWLALTSSAVWPLSLFAGVLGLTLLVTSGGIAPASVKTALPMWLIFAWSLALGVGGVAATIGLATSRDRLESGAQALVAAGAFTYGTVVLVAIPQWTGATAGGFAFVLVIQSLIRIIQISRRHREIEATARLLAIAKEVEARGGSRP